MPLILIRKPVQTVYTEQKVISDVTHMHSEKGLSLRKIAAFYNTRKIGRSITHADIERILKGKFPVNIEKRIRLKIPPICVSCGQKVRHVRQVPAWLNEAVKNLRKLEASVPHGTDADDGGSTPPRSEKRIYARTGRRVI